MDDPDTHKATDDADDERRDAAELEISDLVPRSPDAGPSRLLRPRLDALRARRVRLPLALGTALVLAAVLIAAAWPTVGRSVAALLAVPTPTITPLPTPQPTATPPNTPTPYPSPTLSPLTTLGPAPRDCPPGPAPRNISPEFGPAVGSAPVWVYGNFSASGDPLTLHVAPSPQAPRTLYGWPTPLYAAMSVDATKPVSLQAWNAATGDALWFTVQGNSTSSGAEANEVLLTFDPNHPTQVVGFTGDYMNWFPILYVPAPGCYVMEASWPGGAWTIPFAAGA